MRDKIRPDLPAVAVRRLCPETHRALKLHALGHGRSMEAEIRAILDAAVKPAHEIGIGSALAALGRRFRGVDLEIKRDLAPARPIRFE
jgi:plasmid stability protein